MRSLVEASRLHVWEPRVSRYFYTWTAQKDAKGFELRGGSGVWFDTDEGRWLDLASLVYQVNLGHGDRRMIEAVQAQAGRLCVSHPAARYPEKDKLAEKLIALAPSGFDRVFFTLGGAESNENAIKIARLMTGRYKIVSRYNSYHGASMGAISLSGDWRRIPVEPGLVGSIHVPDFDCAQCPHGVRASSCTHEPLTQIPRVLELEAGTVAAVIVEPVVGANGVLIPPPGYFRRLRQACDAHGALLIVDEVLTGFGRTGRWFAFEHFDGVVPDMITLGKALTGGYGTLGAVLVHGKVAKHFDENILVAGLTHYAHPLGVAAALRAIEICESDGLIEKAAARTPTLRKGLQDLAKKHAHVVRQNRAIGLLSATELLTDAPGWARLRSALERRKVLTHPLPRSGVLILSPPLCISDEELTEGLTRVDEAITEAFPRS